LRYYFSESTIRGYVEGQYGIAWRKYNDTEYLWDSYAPYTPPTSINKRTTIDLAPQYSIGTGAVIPIAIDLQLDLGVQINVMPKPYFYDNLENPKGADGFSQTRFSVGFQYNL